MTILSIHSIWCLKNKQQSSYPNIMSVLVTRHRTLIPLILELITIFAAALLLIPLIVSIFTSYKHHLKWTSIILGVIGWVVEKHDCFANDIFNALQSCSNIRFLKNLKTPVKYIIIRLSIKVWLIWNSQYFCLNLHTQLSTHKRNIW